MTEYFQKNLFKNISIDEYRKLLSCLDGRAKQFEAGETIRDYDEGFHEIGIIDKGTASVVRYEYNGARTTLECLGPQNIFGHLLSYEGSEHAGISIICDGPCDILFIHYATIGPPCTKSCAHHHQLTQSLPDLITERVLDLSRRVEILFQHTIRKKLICYFMQLVAQAKAFSLSLSFTIVDLADYFSIDRNAMTGELKHIEEEELTEMGKRCVRLFF